jgi:Putative Ig domain
MLRTCGLVIAVALLMVACGGGGDAVEAPHDLQYAVGAGTVGSPFGPYAPSISGTVTEYSVSPALPAGLRLDPTSGVISGTPHAASSATTYTVTASNGTGATTAALTFAVLVPPPPTGLTYTSPVTGTVGAALTPVVPTLSGHADAFKVAPVLPAGLTLDPVTGIVSGSPISERVAVTYTITASDSGGASTTADLVLAVGPPPAGTAVTGVFRSDTVIGLGYVSGSHSGLTDTSGAFTYEVGQGIAFSVGAVSIGALPTAKALVTPVDLVAQGTGPSNHVLNVVRFLLMLDQDGNPNNGIQISAAVTAAAASWAPVDFDTADLPTTLGPLIQQASAADGVSHVLPDAATAQAHLRSGFYCTHAGNYYGTFGEKRLAGDGRGDFTASVFPDGSMHSIAYATDTLVGFDVQTNNAVSPLLDGTFAQIDDSLGVNLQGSFADPTVLSGTYLTPVGGSFQAVADASVAATYKFIGGLDYIGMDDSNQVLGRVSGGYLTGTVSGSTFTGTLAYPHSPQRFPVSGTYSNTTSGATFDGQYTKDGSVVTFSTVGCRAN